MNIKLDAEMIAPCGMNCALCYVHQREKNQCMGCRSDSEHKRKGCITCAIALCDKREKDHDFCFSCTDKPCAKLKRMDKTYRQKYDISMFENLELIKSLGVDEFVEREKARWKCDGCGSVICVHDGVCKVCGK